VARILIVEDNSDNMALMAYLLRSFGHEPVPATSGREGIELSAADRPDLILMDIQMPEMDGFEAAAEIRRRHRLRPVNIVAVTAFAMASDRARVTDSGLFDGYIAKPIAPDTFVSEVERHLPAGARATSAEEQVS
jgi:two-component system cell cycle response regulator